MFGATIPQPCSACMLWGTILLLSESYDRIWSTFLEGWMVKIVQCINDEQKLSMTCKTFASFSLRA